MVAYHNGRGSQQGVFAELKPGNAPGYVPTRTWNGNRVYLLPAVLAHSLGKELQSESDASDSPGTIQAAGITET